jgi:hypothetical protein
MEAVPKLPSSPLPPRLAKKNSNRAAEPSSREWWRLLERGVTSRGISGCFLHGSKPSGIKGNRLALRRNTELKKFPSSQRPCRRHNRPPPAPCRHGWPAQRRASDRRCAVIEQHNWLEEKGADEENLNFCGRHDWRK